MSHGDERNGEVRIELPRSEELVLFEVLSRFSAEDRLTVEDQAEARVLWNVQALLERKLTEPFSDNYAELLVRAKKELRGKVE